MQRWIIHIDMDAFFAAVEQRDRPELIGRPVIVGGLSARGVVSTASYEARRYGVHSAMPMSEARRRCPQGVYLTPDHDRYTAVSSQIRAILDRYSPLIEPLSLDEAFLDVTGMEWLYDSPVTIGRHIKDDIRRELELTASAGIAPNKFLAKLASDMQKPDGLVLIRPGEEASILRDLPVSRIWGVGDVTAAALAKRGILTAGQLACADARQLENVLGRSAREIICLAQGRDERPVTPDQPPKSIGNEQTYAEDLYAWETIETELLHLAAKVGWRLRRLSLAARTVTVKVRLASFRTFTRSRTWPEATNLDEVLYQTARELYATIAVTEGVRLLGLTAGGLQPDEAIISLFDDSRDKQAALHKTVDRLKERFGENIVTKGRLLPKK